MILLPFHLLLVKGGIVSSIVGNRLFLAKKLPTIDEPPLYKKFFCIENIFFIAGTGSMRSERHFLRHFRNTPGST